MEHSYYYLDENNQQTGPLSWDELQALHLPGSTLVWHEGLPSWVRLSALTAKSSPRKGFFRNLTPLRIVLLVYAVLGTLLMLAVGRFLFAFLSSYTYRWICELPWYVLLLVTVLFLPALFIKRRRYVVHVALVLLPLWMGSLASGLYYSVLCRAPRYTLNGYCFIDKRGQGCGVLNRWGLESVPCIYDNVSFDDYFMPDYCYVWLDGKRGVCDMEGNVLVSCEWEYITYLERQDLWFVKDEGNVYGLLNADGSPLLPCKYDRIVEWSDESDLLEVRLGDYFGLFSPYEGWVLDCSYLRKDRKVHGCAAVNRGGYVAGNGDIIRGEWGVVDAKGNLIVPFLYDWVNLDEDKIGGHGLIRSHYYDYEGNRLSHE